MYFRQGDYNRALAGYQNAVSIDSSSAVAWYNIGQAYIKKMLFAESSSALQMASDLGIEEYRKAHPGTRLLDLDIYDAGFPAQELWTVAAGEGRMRGSAIIDGIFRPWLLFPLRWTWLLLLSALAAAVAAAAAAPSP